MGKKVDTVENDRDSSKSVDDNALLYRIDKDPQWLLAMVLGFQVNLFSFNT